MLNQIRDNPGASKKRMRVGRGIGSGKGKTSGRGVKGYKARSGSSVNGFEGGQMPLHMRLPKRGFKSLNAQDISVVNLSRLEKLVELKKIKSGDQLDAEALLSHGLIRSTKNPVKLLATGDLSVPLTLIVDYASDAATKKVVAKGGSVQLKSAQE